VGNTCEEAGFVYSFFWNGFAIRDFSDLVLPSDFNLDTEATPYINNQGQILDGWYVLSPIAGAIALDIAYPSSFAGCQNVTAYVSSATPAPKGGLVVSLSDDLAATSVPATVTIPAGAIGATFTITTMPVASVQNGTVTATLGKRTASQPLSIRPIGVSAVTVTPNPVKGGNPVTGNVTLECNAAPASISVTLSSDYPPVAKPVQATITIPKGQLSKSFQVTTTHPSARVKVVISASANGVSKTANLNVNH
jgi:hypothetical protein